jgi:hypothetical protein
MISLMRLAFSSLFLTLVVASANAAPDTSINPAPIQTKETFQKTSSDGSGGSVQKDSVQATEAPGYNPNYIRRGWKEISNGSTNFGIGTSNGAFDKDKDTKSLTTFHLQRTQYNADETAQEFGLNLTSHGYLGFDWGFKKFCCFMSFAGEWKPYYKIGAAAFYEPKDQLANVIDYQRYFWQAAVGLEDPLTWQRQIRLEIGARSGYPGSHFYGQVLYAWPD